MFRVNKWELQAETFSRTSSDFSFLTYILAWCFRNTGQLYRTWLQNSCEYFWNLQERTKFNYSLNKYFFNHISSFYQERNWTKKKLYWHTFPSLFICKAEGLLLSENRRSPRSSKCLRSSAGGIEEEGLCRTEIKSWPPIAVPTIICVPYVCMNLPTKIH